MILPDNFLPSPGCTCELCETYLQEHPDFIFPNSPLSQGNFAIMDELLTNTPLVEVEFDDQEEEKPIMKPSKGIPENTIKLKSASAWQAELTSPTSKVLYLLRGVPGSGKSSLALLIQKGIRGMAPINAMILSADDFFIKSFPELDDLFYIFDPDKLPEAHSNCQSQCRKALEEGLRAVIVANVFSSRNHLLPYLRMARETGYEVVEITIKSNFKNIHGVPEEKIRRIKQGFEN